MADCLKPPEWMIALENKKKHKLAHDVGAGAPCLNCLDGCLGLDLHFWRKLCRNCKCKKEAHDIKEEDSYQQFEILFGENVLKNKEGMRKFAEDLASKLENGPHMKILMESLAKHEKENGIKFDWLPINVPVNIASEYLQQLPVEKLPITGSEGGHFRRQQLEKQMPLHDFDVNNCHDLSSEETKAFTDYVENVKNSVVGQGHIAKIPSISDCHYTEEDRNSINLPSSDYKCSIPKNLNITPKPFRPFIGNKNEARSNSSDTVSSLLPDLLQPTSGLKPPSAFIKSINKSTPNTIGVNNNAIIIPNVDNSSANTGTVPLGLTGLGSERSPEVYGNISKQPYYDKHSVSTLTDENDDKSGDVAQVFTNRQQQQQQLNKKLFNKTNNNESWKENVAPTKHSLETDKNNLIDEEEGHRCHSSVPPSTKIDDRLCSVRSPAQFNVSSYPLQNNALPHAIGNVIRPPHRQEYDVINEQTVTDDRTPKVHFGDATFIEHGGGELADHLARLPSLSENLQQQSVCCHHCKETILPGQVAVQAEKAGVEFIWHPNCFVCNTCKELLVDLIYFFHKDAVYCGRHYAEVINIPRCHACDELIFLKEYTVAEGQSFHVKHFCCFECDKPLAGMQYVPKDDHPVCLPCYYIKYGKKCHSCQNIIGASDPRLGFKELNWHATASCFKCFQCSKSLLGGQFAVRDDHPFCSKECVQQYKK